MAFPPQPLTKLGGQHLSVDSIVFLIALFEIIEKENYFKDGRNLLKNASTTKEENLHDTKIWNGQKC